MPDTAATLDRDVRTSVPSDARSGANDVEASEAVCPTPSSPTAMSSQPSRSLPDDLTGPQPMPSSKDSPGGLSDPVKQYLDDIGQYRQLSREEEVRLSEMVHDRTEEEAEQARDILVRHNLKLVVSIAKDFTRGRFDILELVSPGNEGLMIAAGKFDGSKGVPFANYAAFWIKQRIMKYATEHGFAVRVPPYRSALINKVIRISSQLREALGRDPSADEVAAEIGNDPEEIGEVMQLLQNNIELDAPVGEEGEDGSSRHGFFDDGDGVTREFATGTLGDIDRKRQIRKALTVLDARDARVLTWYFGLEGHRELDLQQIGSRLGVSRERARQIKSAALNELRDRGVLDLLCD